MKFLVFMLNLAIARENCEWIGASAGSFLTCPIGWIAKGLCGSGRRDSCKSSIRADKYTYMLECCEKQTHFWDEERNCEYVGGAAGQTVTCPDSRPFMFGGCGSSNREDCRLYTEKYTTTALCCKDNGLVISSGCAWRYASDGDPMECPKNFLLAGQCGSAAQADCLTDGGVQKQYVGLYCCPYVEKHD